MTKTNRLLASIKRTSELKRRVAELEKQLAECMEALNPGSVGTGYCNDATSEVFVLGRDGESPGWVTLLGRPNDP